jgi:hypothetical protein
MLGSLQVQVMFKYNFRLRTRQGLVVDNVSIQGRDEADAERKLRQMYMHCEILTCVMGTGARKTSLVSFEDVVSLISK